MRLAALAGVFLAALSCGAIADRLRLRPGAAAPFVLSENSSTGYGWRMDAAASGGLDVVSVTDGGHAPGAAMPGAPGTHRWTIRAVKPGRAALVFVYQRPWEPAPVETRRLEVTVAR